MKRSSKWTDTFFQIIRTKCGLHYTRIRSRFQPLCKSAEQTKKKAFHVYLQAFPLLAQRWTNKLVIKKLSKALGSLMCDVKLWCMNNIGTGTVNDIRYFRVHPTIALRTLCYADLFVKAQPNVNLGVLCTQVPVWCKNPPQMHTQTRIVIFYARKCIRWSFSSSVTSDATVATANSCPPWII